MSAKTSQIFQIAINLAAGRSMPDGRTINSVFPTFGGEAKIQSKPSGPLRWEQIYIGVPLTAGTQVVVRIGDPDGMVILDDDDVPATMRAANKSVRNERRIAIPTFIRGQVNSFKTTVITQFRPDAVQLKQVAFSDLLLSDAADLDRDDLVASAFAAAHRVARGMGFATGFPTFLTTAAGLPEIACLNDVLTIEIPPTSVSSGIWTRRENPNYRLGGGDPLAGGLALVGYRASSISLLVGEPKIIGQQAGGLVNCDLPTVNVPRPTFTQIYRPTGTVNTTGGPRSNSVEGEISAVATIDFLPEPALTLNVLFSEGVLRHGTKGETGDWQFTTIDGAGPTANGHVDGLISPAVCLVDAGLPGAPALHAFYFDFAAGDLRHAQRVAHTWQVQTVDGNGNDPGTGSKLGNMNDSVAAVVEPDGTLHAFYVELINTKKGVETFSTHRLRHAVQRGGVWKCQQLDGSAVDDDSIPPGQGPINSPVGRWVTAEFWQGVLWVAYEDASNGNIRIAKGSRSGNGPNATVTWRFEALDGHSRLGGATNLTARAPRIATWGTTLCVFYLIQETGEIKMAGREASGGVWFYSAVDGPGMPDGAACGVSAGGIAVSAIRATGRPVSEEGNIGLLPVTLAYYASATGNLRTAAAEPQVF